jgi:hypothetical protein
LYCGRRFGSERIDDPNAPVLTIGLKVLGEQDRASEAFG